MSQRTRRDFIKQVGAGAVAAAAVAPGAASAATAQPRRGAGHRDARARARRERSHQRRLRRDAAAACARTSIASSAVEGQGRLCRRSRSTTSGTSARKRRASGRRRREVGLSRLPRADRAAGRRRRRHRARRITGTTITPWRRCKAGKHVYLEKPMTYTVKRGEGDRRRGEGAAASVLQVGSQYTLARSLLEGEEGDRGRPDRRGRVGVGRLRPQQHARAAASGTTRSIPTPTSRTLDWKAFLGSAPKRAFDPARYFRWRKYWDYSGGIATDLFYHTMSPLLMTIGAEFPIRVSRVRRHLRAEGSRSAGHVLHERRLSGAGRCSWPAR